MSFTGKHFALNHDTQAKKSQYEKLGVDQNRRREPATFAGPHISLPFIKQNL